MILPTFPRRCRNLAPALLSILAACTPHETHPTQSVAPQTHAAVDTPAPDGALLCRERRAALALVPDLAGAPAFDARRGEFLGRARGEPMVLVREPTEAPDADLQPEWIASRRGFAKGKPGVHMHTLIARHRRDPVALRALLLREGYAYAPDPEDALALVTGASLADLFGDPRIEIQRGSETHGLVRETKRGETVYRYVDGPLTGRTGDLLFGDRVAVSIAALGPPLHRDVLGLAEREGIDLVRITRRTQHALLADLRFGEVWVPAVIDATGARLELGCLEADVATQERVRHLQEASAPRRRAIAALHRTVTQEVQEALRFDRPAEEKTAERDGELRPYWMSAYLQGRQSFEVDGTTYAVYDKEGHPYPPQVCVDFVIDSFDRAAGTWFRPQGPERGRVRGRFDFDDMHMKNRHGVMAFGQFAESHPEWFEYRRFTGDERIPFGDRTRFFGFFADHPGEVRAGDVVAIHGLKHDGRIHQHAILVEWTDPVTGFPFGLADQMKRPRRRTWEGIMAEAEKRSLYYRVRLRDDLFAQMDPGSASSAP